MNNDLCNNDCKCKPYICVYSFLPSQRQKRRMKCILRSVKNAKYYTCRSLCSIATINVNDKHVNRGQIYQERNWKWVTFFTSAVNIFAFSISDMQSVFFWISLWWIILKAVSQNIIHACTCVQIYVSKLRCESYSRRIQACIFGYDHQLNDDCSPKKCIANICNMHDTQMTSIEFCFLTKYSIVNFADIEDLPFILLFRYYFTVFCFFKLIFFSKNCSLSIMFKLLNMTFLCHISFSAKPASLFF